MKAVVRYIPSSGKSVLLEVNKTSGNFTSRVFAFVGVIDSAEYSVGDEVELPADCKIVASTTEDGTTFNWIQF